MAEGINYLLLFDRPRRETERVTEKDRDTETELTHGSNWPGLIQAESSLLKFNMGPPYGCQGPMHLSNHLLSPRTCTCRNQEMEAKSGLKPTPSKWIQIRQVEHISKLLEIYFHFITKAEKWIERTEKEIEIFQIVFYSPNSHFGQSWARSKSGA